MKRFKLVGGVPVRVYSVTDDDFVDVYNQDESVSFNACELNINKKVLLKFLKGHPEVKDGS